MGNAQVAEQENEGTYHEDSQSLQHFANLTGSVQGRVGKDPNPEIHVLVKVRQQALRALNTEPSN